LRNLGIDERMILEWILKIYGVRVCSEFICLRIQLGGGLLNEPLVYVKDREFVDWLSDYQLLEKDSSM
jgi:hypothetical protein